MENNRQFDWRRFWLVIVAFIAGGVVPIQLITLSFGYAQYIQGIPKGPEMIKAAHEFAMIYIPYVYIPSLLVLLSIVIYSRTRHIDLYRRIVVGFGAGAVATFALDAIRQIGVIHNFLPGANDRHIWYRFFMAWVIYSHAYSPYLLWYYFRIIDSTFLERRK